MHESQRTNDDSQKKEKKTTTNSSLAFNEDRQQSDCPEKYRDKKSPNIAQHDGVLLYVLVVGFHHKKGCLIEYCYPPLPDDNVAEIETEELHDQPNKLLEKGDANNDSINLPESWKALPSLAIPDGAHNFDHDTVYFHLPDLHDPTKTVFGVACYQQIMTKKLLVKTPDMTRSSVQKSVVAILRYPLYGFVERKLRIITRGYFNELDFSQTRILKEFYKSMTLQLKPNMIDTCEMYYGLSLQQLFGKFGQQIITLFKLLLLEKKTLFIMSPIRELSSTILSLCSLFPGLLQKGMLQSHLPIELNEKINNQHKDEQYCDQKSITIDQSSNVEQTKLNFQDSVESTISSYDNISPDDYQCDDDDGDDGQISAASYPQQNFETEILIKPYEYYGLPLQLFKCNSYCLPYCSISCFECLNNERVRACVAGSSNSIFQRWENDIDVFVVDNQVIINDPRLKQILAPTVEDSRFILFLLQSINQTSTTALTKDLDIWDESFGTKKMLYSSTMLNHHIDNEDLIDVQHPSKGSDAWCRFHFKNYLLHMLRCSFLDENSKEYCSFNQGFMSEWKMTYNYKTWSNNKSIVDIFEQEIDPQHPFAANRLNDIRFKITNFINNRQEHLNNASKVVLNTAKTTLTSWMTSLSAYGAGQQAKSILSRTVQTFATQFIEDGDDSSLTTDSDSDIDQPMRKARKKQLPRSDYNEKNKIYPRRQTDIDTKSEADSDLEVFMDEEQETSV